MIARFLLLFSESQTLRKMTKLRFAMDVKRERREAAPGPLTDSAETSWSVRASSGKRGTQAVIKLRMTISAVCLERS
jgi:hypothetical protein